jgi:hypothetical protein
VRAQLTTPASAAQSAAATPKRFAAAAISISRAAAPATRRRSKLPRTLELPPVTCSPYLSLSAGACSARIFFQSGRSSSPRIMAKAVRTPCPISLSCTRKVTVSSGAISIQAFIAAPAGGAALPVAGADRAVEAGFFEHPRSSTPIRSPPPAAAETVRKPRRVIIACLPPPGGWPA